MVGGGGSGGGGGRSRKERKGIQGDEGSKPNPFHRTAALVFSDAADLVSHHLETKDTELSTSSPF